MESIILENVSVCIMMKNVEFLAMLRRGAVVFITIKIRKTHKEGEAL